MGEISDSCKKLGRGEEAIGFQVCVLASGSKGNALYLSTGETSLLIDCGLSAAEITRRLEAIGVAPSDLDAILVTHEHRDHVGGVGVFSRMWNVPCHLSYPTLKGITPAHLKDVFVTEFEAGQGFCLHDLYIEPVSIPHDAADPVAFVITDGTRKIGIATDIGKTTALLEERLRGCDLLVMEFNHEPVMLTNGPYPWHLKQRIRGNKGHLSNQEAATFLESVTTPSLKGVFLAHLSDTNNCPALALRAADEVLGGSGIPLYMTHQDRVSAVARI